MDTELQQAEEAEPWSRYEARLKEFPRYVTEAELEYIRYLEEIVDDLKWKALERYVAQGGPVDKIRILTDHFREREKGTPAESAATLRAEGQPCLYSFLVDGYKTPMICG